MPPAPPLLIELGFVLLAYAATLVSFSWIFQPNGLWPLGFVCLVPWAVATCGARRAWLVHWASFLLGWGFFLWNLRWLMPVTGLGYAALGFYLAIYWPLAGWALRTGHRHGVSVAWTLPVVWTACELLRGWVMTGFPWLFLGHAFHAQLPLIQISDLIGAYGVTFLAASCNGVLAAWLLRWQRAPAVPRLPKQRWTATGLFVAALIATLLYGAYRLGEAELRPGPRVAVVQHDFALFSDPERNARPWIVFAEYLRLAADAAAEKPDLLVFPETVWASTQNQSFLAVEGNVVDGVPAFTWHFGRLCHHAVSAFARGDYGAVNQELAQLEILERRYSDARLPRLPAAGGPPVTVVLGSTSIETFPQATYPKFKRYNSALIYNPDGTQRPKRYDKVHLVPFGEIVPFRYGRLHRVYRWLNRLSPFSFGGEVEYSLTPGEGFTVFSIETPAGQTRFGTPICYEDVMPYIIRNYVWDGGERRVDFLVNISNDAWFNYGNELPQHLAICALRAVENRVGIARAVNTGISGFIDPNGRIYSVVEEDGRRFGPGIVGYELDHVLLDNRQSFYGRTGDWFAGICTALTCALWLVAVVERWILAIQQRIASWRRRKEGKPGASAAS